MPEIDLQRRAILEEIERVEENARYTSVTHLVSAQHLKWFHYWVIGPLPIVLGGIGAWKGFANSGEMSGALAALAGIAGSLLSFWNFGDARSKHQTAGAAFKSIEHDARRARLVDGPQGEVAALRRRLEELAERYNKLAEASVHTSQFAFGRAQKLISSGVYTNTVDERRPAAVAGKGAASSLPAAGESLPASRMIDPARKQ